MLAGDRPTAFSPKIADSASGKDDVETPLRYSAGINASIDGARRIYRGKMAELNVLTLSCIPSPSELHSAGAGFELTSSRVSSPLSF